MYVSYYCPVTFTEVKFKFIESFIVYDLYIAIVHS